MYDQICEIIASGGYRLGDMVLKIDRFWLEGAIDATQRDELKQMARDGADPQSSYGSESERILSLETALRALESRVAALESAFGTDAQGTGESGSEGDQWPEWVQPVGAHDAYSIGDRVTYNGRRYESIIDGNVWSPSVFPAGWQEVA